jgi:putative nucleotidyltransferase with HDIG domain
MSASPGILLISDRPQWGKELAAGLQTVAGCRMIEPGDRQTAAPPSAVVVLDVDLRRSSEVENLRALLTAPRRAAIPIVALLRNESHVERVQAAALGASTFVAGEASPAELRAVVAALARPAVAEPSHAPSSSESLDQARLKFAEMFNAAANGATVEPAVVDQGAGSVMAAIADGGIRQWLDIVWTYDDTTYQHCMLVTGLAAAFAGSLGFSEKDQKHLVRGALLHDVGKAKIPLAILNKPGRLDDDELKVMRRHAEIGYELLRAQGEYEPELLEVVLRHHELLDGSGYPGGLSGPQINDLVRLTTICDIYAALIERRPYKQPIEPPRAFKILQDMGGKLEAALVQAFARVAENSSQPLAAIA